MIVLPIQHLYKCQIQHMVVMERVWLAMMREECVGGKMSEYIE